MLLSTEFMRKTRPLRNLSKKELIYDEGEYEEAIDRYLEVLEVDSTSMWLLRAIVIVFSAQGFQTRWTIVHE